MEAYLSVAIVFGIWALCVFIESKRDSHVKPKPTPETPQVPDVNYGIVETTDTLGKVNPNTSAKKRKRQRKQRKR